MRIVALLFLAACGSSGIAPGLTDDGGADGGGDGGAGNDLAMSLGDMAMYQPPTDGGAFKCGPNPPCVSPNICCARQVGDGGTAMCATTCAGGHFIQCLGPGNCGGDPCCLTLSNMMPQDILCTTMPNACVPTFDLSGNGMTRLCKVDGDCTAGGVQTMYDQCCHSTMTGTKFCFSASGVPFTGGRIACP